MSGRRDCGCGARPTARQSATPPTDPGGGADGCCGDPKEAVALPASASHQAATADWGPTPEGPIARVFAALPWLRPASPEEGAFEGDDEHVGPLAYDCENQREAAFGSEAHRPSEQSRRPATGISQPRELVRSHGGESGRLSTRRQYPRSSSQDRFVQAAEVQFARLIVETRTQVGRISTPGKRR